MYFPWGIDFHHFKDGDGHKARAELNIPPDRVLAVIPARLAPDKGHLDALKAIKSIPDKRFGLLLVGDGPLRREIEQRALSLGLSDRVYFSGRVERKDMPDYLSAARILLLPSYREGLPIVIAEGFIAGIPPVAYNTDGVGELVKDGITGRLVKKGNIAGLKAAIEELLCDGQLCDRFVSEGRKLLLDSFSEKAMVEKLEKLYPVARQRGMIF